MFPCAAGFALRVPAVKGDELTLMKEAALFPYFLKYKARGSLYSAKVFF